MVNEKRQPNNILIPFSLFEKILEVLECCDVSGSGLVVQKEHSEALCALRAKQDSIDLREAYSNIVRAKNDDQRGNARDQYLRRKRFYNDSRLDRG